MGKASVLGRIYCNQAKNEGTDWGWNVEENWKDGDETRGEERRGEERRGEERGPGGGVRVKMVDV
jgi:hypothetical protein